MNEPFRKHYTEQGETIRKSVDRVTKLADARNFVETMFKLRLPANGMVDTPANRAELLKTDYDVRKAYATMTEAQLELDTNPHSVSVAYMGPAAKREAAPVSKAHNALNARFDEIATLRKCTREQAAAWALQHDAKAQELYRDFQNEGAV